MENEKKREPVGIYSPGAKDVRGSDESLRLKVHSRRVESPKPSSSSPAGIGDSRERIVQDFAPQPGFSFGLQDVLFALALFAAALLSVGLTYTGFGHSWDEALYFKPAVKAAQWIEGLLGGDGTLVQQREIERFWGARFEDSLHPEIAPVPKIVIGLGAHLLPWQGFEPIAAMRLPIAAAFGLTVVLLYLLGARAYGRTGGFAAAVIYALMPRVFGHAHIAASETLLAFAAVFLVWAFLAGIVKWPAAILTALAFALAIGTKVTALLLPVPLILWGQIYYRREYSTNIFAMLFLAPIVAVAIWPWLWYDTAIQFLNYLRFYVAHQSTAVYYLGRLWGYTHGPAAPWHYPAVITILSLPEWVLAFAALGLIRSFAQAGSRPVPVLFLFMAAFPVALSSAPGAPKYDGERLFFPAFAFIALLAAGGYTWLLHLVWKYQSKVFRSWISGMFLLALGVWGAYEIAEVHPNELNYFNWIIGGPKGAMAAGFETSYWGEAVNEEVVDTLNSLTKPGAKVKTLALNELVFQNLQEWKDLHRDVDFSPSAPPYDWYVLQVRQGFLGEEEKQLRANATPEKVFSAHGVPRIEIYKGNAMAAAKIGLANTSKPGLSGMLANVLMTMPTASPSSGTAAARTQATTTTVAATTGTAK